MSVGILGQCLFLSSSVRHSRTQMPLGLLLTTIKSVSDDAFGALWSEEAGISYLAHGGNT